MITWLCVLILVGIWAMVNIVDRFKFNAAWADRLQTGRLLIEWLKTHPSVNARDDPHGRALFEKHIKAYRRYLQVSRVASDNGHLSFLEHCITRHHAT